MLCENDDDSSCTQGRVQIVIQSNQNENVPSP